MCGVFTSSLRAPLTGIFLIVEVTGDFMLMIPLMIVSGLSYFTAKFFEPYSVYTKVLGEKHLIEAIPLQQINRHTPVGDAIETDFSAVGAQTPLAELRATGESAKITYLPVIDANRKLLGIVMPDRLAAATDPKLTAAALMMEPLLTLSPKDDANKAQISFEIYGLDYLPVIDGGKFIGFVPKTRFEPAPAAEEATA